MCQGPGHSPFSQFPLCQIISQNPNSITDPSSVISIRVARTLNAVAGAYVRSVSSRGGGGSLVMSFVPRWLMLRASMDPVSGKQVCVVWWVSRDESARESGRELVCTDAPEIQFVTQSERLLLSHYGEYRSDRMDGLKYSATGADAYLSSVVGICLL